MICLGVTEPNELTGLYNMHLCAFCGLSGLHAVRGYYALKGLSVV